MLLHVKLAFYVSRVFQNIMLKKMFGSVMEEGAGGNIIHAEQPYEFYSSASTVSVKKSRKIIGHGTSHVRGRRERHTWFWVGNPKGRSSSKHEGNI
jgi:hypothetical protein